VLAVTCSFRAAGDVQLAPPSYCRLLETGELNERVVRLHSCLAPCTLCPHRCGVDRRRELGTCATPAEPIVASWGPHFGEEPPLSARRGSGALFLGNCNLRCTFCQNADISQRPDRFSGLATPVAELAEAMLELQRRGCHNVNWVSPTHQAPQLVAALSAAARRGLRIPIVYNTNSYDSVDVLRLLDGVVDVYLPDLKYADSATARHLSGSPAYVERSRAAVTEMFRQVGDDWTVDGEGALQRGLLVRLLVLPGGLAGVGESLRWLAEALSPRIAVSLMSQYRPAHHAARSPGQHPLGRRVRAGEWAEALGALARYNTSANTYVQRHMA
jgi:putative pyruvate formate lyase activating enzyme